MGALQLSLRRAAAILALALGVGACAPSAASPAVPEAARHTPPFVAQAGPQPTSSHVPIEEDDGVWGAANAPVTLVVFTDLECPYCAEAHAAIVALEHEMGPAQLRVVIKHVPLAQHAGAVPAARVAQAIRAQAGANKFFEFLDLAFAEQPEIAAGRALDLAARLGVARAEIEASAASTAIGAEVLRDVTLANRLGVAATPHLRVNGRGYTGVVPLRSLRRLVQAELEAADKLRSAAVPSEQVYARRVAENFTRGD